MPIVKQSPPIAETCNICVETFNKSTRKQVICDYCDFLACSSCCQTYLLSIDTPKCMNCNTAWNRETLQKKMTKSFIETKLKPHHKEYLFNLEKALLAQTMPEVEKYKNIRNINIEIKKLDDQVTFLERHKIDLYKKEKKLCYENLQKSFVINKNITLNNNGESELNFIDSSEVKKINKKIRKLLDEINTLKMQLGIVKNNGNTIPIDFYNSSKIILRCPSNNCKAFLNKDFHCTLCNIDVCEECHQIMSENHLCNKNDIETVQAIKNNTKPCPSCAVPIFKINGCDQMWCVNCHTAFNWVTGNKETNNIHNPHYHQWMREKQNGIPERNPLDFACGRDLGEYFLQDFNNIQKKIQTTYNRDKYAFSINIYYNKIYEFIQILNHILHDTIPKYQENRQNKNTELRIKYILNEIDESKFKTELFSNEKFTARNKEILDLLTMYVHVSTDIIHKIYQNAYNIAYKNEIIDPSYKDELEKLTDYFKTTIANIGNIYNTKIPQNINSSIEEINKLLYV